MCNVDCLSPSWMLDWFLEKWSMTVQMSILLCSQVFTTLTSYLISLTHTEEWDDVFLIRSYSYSEQQKEDNLLSLLVSLQALVRTMCLYWAWGDTMCSDQSLQALVRTMCLYWAWGDTMCSDVFTWYLKLEGGASFWALCSNFLIFVSVFKKKGWISLWIFTNIQTITHWTCFYKMIYSAQIEICFCCT